MALIIKLCKTLYPCHPCWGSYVYFKIISYSKSYFTILDPWDIMLSQCITNS